MFSLLVKATLVTLSCASFITACSTEDLDVNDARVKAGKDLSFWFETFLQKPMYMSNFWPGLDTEERDFVNSFMEHSLDTSSFMYPRCGPMTPQQEEDYRSNQLGGKFENLEAIEAGLTNFIASKNIDDSDGKLLKAGMRVLGEAGPLIIKISLKQSEMAKEQVDKAIEKTDELVAQSKSQ